MFCGVLCNTVKTIGNSYLDKVNIHFIFPYKNLAESPKYYRYFYYSKTRIS